VNSGKAIFSMICGIVFFLPPLAIAAVILGHLSLSDIRRSSGRLKGRGCAITGLVLGYLELAICSIVLILAAFSVSKVLKAGMPTNETSTVSAMRTLNTAEIAYAQAHRSGGYTCSLSDLSKSWGLSPDLARGQTNGYVFTLQGCSSQKPDGPIMKYRIVAYPVRVKAGLPAFCSNESDVIKVARNGSVQDCLQRGVNLSATEINHPHTW
jgi:hypothetical protein